MEWHPIELGEQMEIEFRFHAQDDDPDSRRDLRTLYAHLRDDSELQRHARISARPEPERPGELGAAEIVLAAVQAGTGAAQLAIAVRAWRDALNQPTSIQLFGPPGDDHREMTGQITSALSGNGTARESDGRSASPGRTASAARIDPNKSACVIIGVDQYHDQNLPRLHAVSNNVEELSKALQDDHVWGIKPGRLRVVDDPETPAELIAPIREMSEMAGDTLVVYFSGHGLKNLNNNELYLALPGSVPGRPETAVRYADVKQAIKDNRQSQRVVIVLDCCYSGTAMEGGMSGPAEDIRADADVNDVQGSYLMCSAASDRKALAPNAEGCTVFTGELVDVLRNGIPDEPGSTLSLSTIFRTVRRRLRRANLPDPQEQDLNQVGQLAFVTNIAQRKPSPDEAVPPPPPTRRGPRWIALCAAVLVGFVGGMAVQPAIELARRQPPTPPGGACSPNATLLDHSDQLDKHLASGEPVFGLSALALTGDAEGLALADSDSGRAFPVSFGSADNLNLTADTATTLKDVHGTPYGGNLDGEGLVIEPGTGTMLVSSERGPAIRRFRLSDGGEVGSPLPIPQGLRLEPEGGAQHGRTIEALAATPDGRYVYAGWESPLSNDGDEGGRNRLRIQRYVGNPGGDYLPDRQYAYETKNGLNLTELAVLDPDHLLALERHYVEGLGNSVRVSELRLTDDKDVTDTPALADAPADAFVQSTTLFSVGDCPAGSPGQVQAHQRQPNPLLDNVEGMAVGPDRNGSRLLYLVSDDNRNAAQITRLYTFRIHLP